MLSESLDVQVSGNSWNQASIPMVYQDFQQVAVRVERREQRELFRDLENQMADFEAQHEAAITELRKQYVLPIDSSVVDFLRQQRTIPQLLNLAVPQLKLHFGVDTIFTLRAPIDESGARTLYAVAMWPGKARDAKNAIDKFDDAWWIANSRQASGNLYFTYELV
jgi:hypothetical protein